MSYARSCSWFDDTEARFERLRKAKEEAQMVVARTAIGEPLCIEQQQCSVVVRLGQFEVVFAGEEQLVGLKWLLCGTRSEAVGSGGATFSVKGGNHGVTITLQSGKGTRECQLLRKDWDHLTRGEFCNAITAALNCPSATPLIQDPAV